jgi:hypothetical protein
MKQHVMVMRRSEGGMVVEIHTLHYFDFTPPTAAAASSSHWVEGAVTMKN